MGYDLHITRAEDWLDAQNRPIDREEWHTYAKQHPGLVEAGWTGSETNPDREPVYALIRREGSSPSLAWDAGEVTVSGPDMDHLPDLVAIAADLRANAIGDDGERYTAEGVAQ